MKEAIVTVLTFPFRLIWWLVSLPFRLLGWLLRPVWEMYKKGSIYQFFTVEPDEKPLGDVMDATWRDPNVLLEHVEHFRSHLLRILVGVFIGVAISFTFTEQLVAFLAFPVGGLQNLQAIEVTESIGVFMRVALMAGLALASPYIAFELWFYLAPGMKARMRLYSLLAIPMSLLFFVGGMAFSFYVMLPTALPFLLDFLGVTARLRPASYFEFATGIMFWIGVAFQFPLVIFALSGLGWVKPRQLIDNWRIAVILIAVLSAMITPTIDPINMALVMSPMIALYFLSVFFSWLAQLGRGKPEATPV